MLKTIEPDFYEECADREVIIIEGREGDYDLGETVIIRWSAKPITPGMVRDFSNGLFSVQVKELSEY